MVAGLVAFSGDDEQPKPQPTPTPTGEKINVPFTDPGRPGRLTASIMQGNIRVHGYSGQAVIVETKVPDGDAERREGRGDRSGLRRIPNMSSGLTIEEENNEMRISAQWNKDIVLDLQVPFRTALKLSLTNGDDITVENVESDMEINNVNGGVFLTNVAGTAIVHSTNGEIKATFRSVSGKPMSFTTFNGDVDVSLPADIKATVRLDSGQGDTYTDFPVEMMPTALQQTVEDNRSKGGKYRIKIEKAMIGRINGGGTEYTFKTFNGDIHLRRYSGAAAPAK
jgi:DUF4097 and DUF4098 domain-containing protein YvlB